MPAGVTARPLAEPRNPIRNIEMPTAAHKPVRARVTHVVFPSYGCHFMTSTLITPHTPMTSGHG